MAKPQFEDPSDEISFNLINPDVISRLERDGEIEMPEKRVNVSRDERWNAKQMASKILQGILHGDSVEDMSNSMMLVIGNNVSSAVRNTRTMITNAENHGRLDSYDNLAKQGVVMRKIWIATPDERTRESHLAIDGQERDLDKEFSNGCRFPGDGRGPSEEVWMCRCSMGTHIVGFRRKDGSISYVEGEMDNTEHDSRVEAERNRRATMSIGDGKERLSYSDRIKAIADDVAKNGITSEKVMEAGRIFSEEVNSNIAIRQNSIETAKREYDLAGKNVIDEINADPRYTDAQRISVYEQYGKYGRGIPLSDSEYWRDSSIEEVHAYLDAQRRRISEIENSSEFLSAKAKYEEARAQLRDVNNNIQTLYNQLSEIRPMGAGDLDIYDHLNRSRSPMRKVIEEVYDYYPTSWVEASVRSGRLTPTTSDRGYYDGFNIALSRGDSNSRRCAVHELGHRFEEVVPGMLDQEKSFYELRTAGEELQWLGEGYARTEKTRFDNFIRPYMGKYYDGTAYELVSMGFELAYTNPTELAKDPEMQSWILGLLSVVP